jgi:hypothetical protein
MIKSVNHLTDEQKLNILEEFRTTGMTQKEIRDKYNLKGHACILNWMRKFGFSQSTQIKVEQYRPMSKETTNKTTRELELEARIKELEKDLYTERFRTKALNTMINIIERDLKIPVRKKFGTKQ